VDVGGDWYDLIALDEHRLLLVVGDVSGRGLTAATTMASLRYAIHAYVAQRDSPASLLSKLSSLISVDSSGQIATVLFAIIDGPAHQISITNAGHLPPLMITNGRAELLPTEVGLPVGVDAGASYRTTHVSAPAGATCWRLRTGSSSAAAKRSTPALSACACGSAVTVTRSMSYSAR